MPQSHVHHRRVRMNLGASPRLRVAPTPAVKAVLRGPVTGPVEYEIVGQGHKPDMRGEFAGVKVNLTEGKQIVRLTQRQAQYWLDQGAIKLRNPPPDQAATKEEQPQAAAVSQEQAAQPRPPGRPPGPGVRGAGR